jgi:integrase
MGLRAGEIEGLLWENYRDGAIFVSRSIWKGLVSDPKTRKGRASVPVIRPLAERLEIHRLRCGSPAAGPIFVNMRGKPLALGSVVKRSILPALNRCVTCAKSESDHQRQDHAFELMKASPNGMAGMQRDADLAAICTAWGCQRKRSSASSDTRT